VAPEGRVTFRGAAVPDTSAKLNEAILAVRQAYHRVVLLVGPSNSGKTRVLRKLAEDGGSAYLNVNLALSQRMLELTKSQRARQADRLLKDLVNETKGDVVLLDNLEVLFDTTLQLDPLRLLQRASRSRTVVAAWNGTFRDGTLTYAEPQHPEYRCYRDVDAITVLVERDVQPHP